MEYAVEQHENKQKADRDDQLKPRSSILQILKFARPREAIAARQFDILRDALLCLGDRAAEIAIAHAEFDRNVAFPLLVIDIRGASIETDVGKLIERNVGVGTAATRHCNFDVADGFEARAILGGKPNSHGELAVAFQ